MLQFGLCDYKSSARVCAISLPYIYSLFLYLYLCLACRGSLSVVARYFDRQW